MKNTPLILILAIVASVSCTQSGVDLHPSADGIAPADTLAVELPAIDSVMPSDIVLTKQIAFEDYTLDDVYPWRDTVRSFKWEVIKTRLAAVENAQLTDKRWGVLQNYKNRNRTAPLVRTWTRNNYGNITDSLGVERYQSVPLYAEALRKYVISGDGPAAAGEITYFPVHVSQHYLMNPEGGNIAVQSGGVRDDPESGQHPGQRNAEGTAVLYPDSCHPSGHRNCAGSIDNIPGSLQVPGQGHQSGTVRNPG